MSDIRMRKWSFSGHKRTTETTSTWHLSSADRGDVTFPSNERIAVLWEETIPSGGKLKVIDDRSPCYRGVEIPRGINPKQRQPFLDALGKDVTPE